MKSLIMQGAALLGAVAMTTTALAGPEWIERGDAGPNIQQSQKVTGNGQLGKISGTLGDLLADGETDRHDMYEFIITEPTLFKATTVKGDGGSADFDSSLWLFKLNGLGLQGNNDTDIVPPIPFGVDQGGTLLYAANDPAGVVIPEPGHYIVCIAFEFERPLGSPPKAGTGLQIFDFEEETERSSPDGPGGEFPQSGWTNVGLFGPEDGPEGFGGPYEIVFESSALIPDEVVVPMDIKPGGCPNSFNRGSNGVLPISVLGTVDFDVHDIDLSTVVISRADGIGGSASPHEGPPGPHSVYDDTGTPFVGADCDCHELEGDGIEDLSMKFKSQVVVAALELNDLPAGDLVQLKVSGQLDDGSNFAAFDCVRLVPPGSPPGLVDVAATVKGGWINVAPMDLNLDGGGFAKFQRKFPQGTVMTLNAPPVPGRIFYGWRINDGPTMQSSSTLQFTVNQSIQKIEAVYQLGWSASQ